MSICLTEEVGGEGALKKVLSGFILHNQCLFVGDLIAGNLL